MRKASLIEENVILFQSNAIWVLIVVICAKLSKSLNPGQNPMSDVSGLTLENLKGFT